MLAADCTGVYLFPRPLKRLRKRIYRNQSLEIINEWTSFQSHGFSPSVYLAGHTYKKINTRFDIEGRPIIRESRYFSHFLRSKNATRGPDGEREAASIGQAR